MTDHECILLAIKQAQLGLGQTSPNPSVGSVIVCGDLVVGEGFHAKAGTPHAERMAIADAESKGFNQWSEATIYVTLEPCSTHGRTGACSMAIIEKGFRRVVYGSVDPNPEHEGRVDQLFRSSGISVTSGVLKEECDTLIRGFKKAQLFKRPWVIVKSAMSLDGKITRPVTEGQWLTNPESRREVHQLRSEVDAIITGGNTLRLDNPRLNVRIPGRDSHLRSPKRVVFTRDRSQLPPETHLMRDADTLVYETSSHQGFLDALTDLASTHGVQTLLVEAGGGLIGEFFDASLVDEVVFFFAPLLTGGRSPGVSGVGALSLDYVTPLNKVRYKKIGNDLMLRGIVSESAGDVRQLRSRV